MIKGYGFEDKLDQLAKELEKADSMKSRRIHPIDKQIQEKEMDYKEKQYHPAFAACQTLMDVKAKDYGQMDHARRNYFPFGDASYATMLHTKMERIKRLIEKDSEPNFEGLKDTVMDLINYGAFYFAYLEQMERERETHS